MFRKMRRFKQQLSDERCSEILKNEPRGVLAVLGNGGYPYTVPLDFVYSGGKIYFHSAVEGHKVDALKAYDKASFCVLSQREKSDDGWSYFFDSVVCFGRLSIIEGAEERLKALTALGMKYFPTEKMVSNDIAKNGARALVIRLDIEYMSGKHVHER